MKAPTAKLITPVHDQQMVLALSGSRVFRSMNSMEVHFKPDLQAKLDKLATETGRPTGELVEDAVAGYFEELVQAREMLNSRYDDLESGRVKRIDGEEFFESLRRREDELLKKNSPR
jgi:predicted transcriptional regulator